MSARRGTGVAVSLAAHAAAAVVVVGALFTPAGAELPPAPIAVKLVAARGPMEVSERVAFLQKVPEAREREWAAATGWGPPIRRESVCHLGGSRWLARHQEPDGRWSSDRWQVRCSRERERCRPLPGVVTFERGDPRFDVGVSSLAVLAFLGNGQTHRFGQFKRTVHRAVLWLRRQQKGDGSIGFDPADPATIYNHALGTIALCEAYALSRDFTLKKYAAGAAWWLARAQRPDGGWGYRADRSDVVVTGWALLALSTAQRRKLFVPPGTLDRARAFLDSVTTPDGTVGYEAPTGRGSIIPGIHERFDEVPGPTAVASLGRVLCGEANTAPAVVAGAGHVGSRLPRWPSPAEVRAVDYHYIYFGTELLRGQRGPSWRRWNQAMQEALLKHQRMGGCADGSFEPVGPWCVAGGRVYATAMAAISLEVYYRWERSERAKK